MVARRPPSGTDLGTTYNVEQLVYPPSLGWLKENQNYVAFYINIPEPLDKDGGVDLMDIDDPVPGSTQGATTFGITNRKYKRIKDAIVLPIMDRPTASYSADFDTTALGPVVGWALTNGTAGYDNAMNSVLGEAGTDWQSMGKLGLDAAKAAAAAAVNVLLPNSLDGNTSAADIFSTIRKTAFNEHRTQVFRGMRFREFQFDYHFAPRDEAEATIIKNIIQKFKFHMHPDNAKSNVFLTYPSEFEIVFYFKEDENVSEEPMKQNMFKISSCALVSFNVQYGGNQFFTFNDGMPTEISMRLGFQELELLTKERIKQGF